MDRIRSGARTPPRETLLTTAAEAARLIVSEVARQPAVRIPLDDALDSILFEQINAPFPLPPWPNAAMDGYALRGDDIAGASADAPVRLTVVGTVAAGQHRDEPIGAGQCVRIFTGAPVPPGADSVVRQEDTDLGEAVVAMRNDRDAGCNVRPAGGDLAAGALALAAGTQLGPAELALLAALAVAQPMVYRRPRVGILAGGDELADLEHPDDVLVGRRVGNANGPALRALVRRAGGEPVDLGVARDTPASLHQHLDRAVDCDLLLTTGGISVGAHDHLRRVLSERGLQERFWRLRIRPGGPVAYGWVGELPWIGLPGNPVSTMVTFELLARPAIRRMMGHALPFRRVTRVEVAEPIRGGHGLTHFVRVTLDCTAPVPLARLTGGQSSNLLTSMTRADALLIVPEGRDEVAPGEQLGALVQDDPVHQGEPGF
ncbi:MAG TPA: gephyrin-like molybdotransferase Glp [Gemmatimonadales bacterium]|nr:gephyrin-like molybdotransferase Glp [Gemmatimonadales bacterium]